LAFLPQGWKVIVRIEWWDVLKPQPCKHGRPKALRLNGYRWEDTGQQGLEAGYANM
jgi:hypothetical protein